MQSFIGRSTFIKAYWHSHAHYFTKVIWNEKLLKLFVREGFFFLKGEKDCWLIDWLNSGSLIISGNEQDFFLTTNKQRPINETIFRADLWRKQSVQSRGESTPFFTETGCHEFLVTSDVCTSFHLLLLYFVPPLIFSWVLRNTLDSISQPIPVALLEAKREK